MAPPPQLQTIAIDRLSPGAVLFSYNQPKIANAFTIQQYHDMRAALLWAREEDEIRIIVQTGKGKHYCAGKILAAPGTGPTIEEEISAGRGLGEVLVGYPKVLIAAINGASIGWGCTQLANFDLVYAAEEAWFQTPFMSLGLVPEGSSSYTFPNTMGKAHANRFLLAAEKVPAHDAYISGLVTQVIPGTKEEFLAKVCEKAKHLATFSGESLKMAKALSNRPTELAKHREQGVLEGYSLQTRANSADSKAMVKQFTDKAGKSKI